MKAILRTTIVTADTRAAKVVRLFGLPIYIRQTLDVGTNKDDYAKDEEAN